MKKLISRLISGLVAFRRSFLWKLHSLSDRKEGEVKCWWMLLLWFIMRPVTIIEMLAARVISPPNFGTVKISGMKFSMEFFRMLDTSPTPGPWFRITKRRRDGVIVLEQKKEEIWINKLKMIS